MSTPFVGQILLFPFNFAPKGFALCQGQLMSISQNTALFSLLGTIYGGNGTTNFALPDLRSRVALGFGQGPGLSDRLQGELSGTETVTLLQTEMPAHLHTIDASGLTATAKCRSSPGNQLTPVGNVPAMESAGVTATYSDATADMNMSNGAIALAGGVTAAAGGGLPHENRQPYLVMNYCIALNGIFPPRS
jgi:microcystin-dependent protein